MGISAGKIKELRDLTGAGVMDCKKALTEAKGDIAKAQEILKDKGLEVALSKVEREAKEGVVDSYIHAGNRLGVLVEVNCETDFVSRNKEFLKFVHDVAMHIAATKPKYVTRANVPASEDEKLKSEKKELFYKTTCLMDQSFIKDESLTVNQVLTNLVAKIGENIVVRRFVHFELGE